MSLVKPSVSDLNRVNTNPSFNPFFKDLIGCWLFNERSGSILHDISPLKAHATLDSGTAGVWTGDRYDNTGSAVYQCPNVEFYNTTLSHTVTVRFNLDAVASFYVFLSKYENASRLFQYGVYQSNIYGSQDDRDSLVQGSATLQTGVDYIATYVYDAKLGFFKVYLDGELAGTDTTINIPLQDTTTEPLRLLGREKNGVFDSIVDGRVDFIYFHKRALSEEEIKRLHSDPYFWNRNATNPNFYALEGAENILSGSIGAGVTVTGNLQGIGSLSGSIDSGVTLYGNLTGISNISGTIDADITATGNLQGLGSLSGSINAGVTVSGDLSDSGSGLISGSIDAGVIVSGDIKGIGVLSGSIDAGVTVSGGLTAQGDNELSGSINTGVNLSGNLTGISDISGSIDVGVAVSGDLSGIGSLSGSTDAGVSISGNLTGISDLSGSIDAGINLSGNLTGISNISGSIDAGVTVSGDISASISGALSGSISLGLILSGSLIGIGSLSGSIDSGISASGNLTQTGVPTLDPFEIRIRDGIATLALNMTQSNGYYYDVGDVNVFEVANVTNWPRLLVTMINEDNLDDDGFRPTNTHYTNVIKFNIRYEWENLLGVDIVDRQKIAAKMAHDIKKLFGDYYDLSEYGAYQSRVTGYSVSNSKDVGLPVLVDVSLECEYYQQRLTPTVS